MTEQEIIDALKVPGGSITLGVTESAPVKKKPMPVIKKGDMSPETKALPDEVVKPPKGIGKSENDMEPRKYKKGGMVKSSASKRADGIAVRGKTRGKIC
jgi:hypothetical protein